ncbi:efflux RND transporter periplasmic adaptor subunit [Saltatorellus ferox]
MKSPSKSSRPSILLVLAAGTFGCHGGAEDAAQAAPHGASPTKEPAATVIPHEWEASLVRLAPDVQASLNVQVVPARAEAMQKAVRRPAIVVLRPDRRAAVAAPVTGSIEPSAAGFPALGDEIERDQVLFLVSPQLSVERDLLTGPQALDVDLKELDLRLRLEEANGLRETARTALVAADRELDRARALVEANIVGSRRLDDARTIRDLAAVDVETAERRVGQLEAEEARPTTSVDAAEPMEVRAPIAGRLDGLTVRPGQVVPAGQEVLAIVDDTHPWLMVQLYASEPSSVDLSADVAVYGGVASDEPSIGSATPLVTPSPLAPPVGMVSRLYRLDADGTPRAPGERLFVDLPTKAAQNATVIPWSSLIFDAHGGIWVYEEKGPHEFRRRAIRFLERNGDLAWVSEELGAGTPVVATGAYELFAIEFGGGGH